MPQFDVYPNPSRSSREDIPFVVDVQSNLLRDLQSRLVMPLALSRAVPGQGPKALCPEVEVEGVALRALPHLAGAIRARELGRPVASLAHDASALVRSLDAVVSGI